MSALPQPAHPTYSADAHADAGLQPRNLPREHTRDQTPTLVGHGSEFVGQLHCPGDLTIAGQGEGVTYVEGTFVLSQNASWRGEVYCAHAILAGNFTGRLHTPGKVEIHASARLQGDLHVGHMSIATGAKVAATIVMTDRTPDTGRSARK